VNNDLGIERFQVVLRGISDIMFKRFIDHSREVRPPEQLFYLLGKQLVLPAENVISFLSCDKPPGCARKFEGKGGPAFAAAALSYVFFDPLMIPFLDDSGRPIVWTEFDGVRFRVDETAGRTKQGSMSIKQEVVPRPVLMKPWQLAFEVILVKNTKIDREKLHNWFIRGGIEVALGTYRPRYGRFEVKEFKPI